MRTVPFIIILFANILLAQNFSSDSLLLNNEVRESKLINSVVDSIVAKYNLNPSGWSLQARLFRGFVNKSGYINVTVR